MTRRERLNALARAAAAHRARGNWQAAELSAAAWYRLNDETDRSAEVSGLARRRAARLAPVPLDARIVNPRNRPVSPERVARAKAGADRLRADIEAWQDRGNR